MKNYHSSGNVVVLTAPAGGVVSGRGIKIGQLFVVAMQSAAAGQPFAGEVTGVHELPKNATQAFTEGALLFWSDANQNLTTTAPANMLIGVAAAAAAANALTALVLLSGAPRPDEP